LERGKYSDTSRKVLVVDSMLAGLAPSKLLQNGDVLLAINDEPIMTNQGLDDLPQNAGASSSVAVSVLRAGVEAKLQVPTAELTTCGTQRFVCFAGLTLQPTYESVRFHGFVPEGVTSGVYCSQWSHGSPAQTYQCRARVWVVQVNGVDVPDLDAFLDQVSKCADRSFLRLKVVNLHAQTLMWTLCTDLKYWPTCEMRRVEGEWVLRTIEHTVGSKTA
jgi:S1-C subfamily serine protease